MRPFILFACLAYLQAADPVTFPYPLPPLDPPPAAVAAVVAGLGPAPITVEDRVRTEGGHFTDGRGARVRLAGVNITGGACFPDEPTAERIATRLRAFGLNAVRIHHIDAPWAEPNIFHASGMSYGKPTGSIDPAMAQRLANFLAILGRHGVHVDLNLKVTRIFQPSDGFSDSAPLPDEGKIIGYFDQRAIDLQTAYARQLLTTTTSDGCRIADLPNLAMIELNNEDSIVYRPERLALLPPEQHSALTAGWNTWLRRTHGSTVALVAAWNQGLAPLGDDLLDASSSWHLERQGTGATMTAGPDTMRLAELRVDGIDWHVQVHRLPLTLRDGEVLTVSFRARADAPRPLQINLRQTEDPWGFVALGTGVQLGAEWRTYTIPITINGTAGRPVRLSFMAGDHAAAFELTEVRLRRGSASELPADQRIEDGTVALAQMGSNAAGHDMARYLMSVEAAYGEHMRRLLRDELGVLAPIGVSQAGFGGLAGIVREAAQDFVDQHQYWDHPSFPGRWWDMDNWRTANRCMLREHGLGELAKMAQARVAGHPATLTEYNHPAPNEYLAECVPLLFTVAAQQDWDAVFLFAWTGDASWKKDHIQGFFDVSTHPAHLAHLAAFSRMFRSGSLAPLTATRTLTLPLTQVPRLVGDGAWPGIWATVGADQGDAALWRWQVSLDPVATVPALRDQGVPTASAARWRREIGSEMLTVDQSDFAAIAGFAAGRVTDLPSLSLDARPTPHGFLTFSAASCDGLPLARSARILVAAIDKAENANLAWNAEHTFAPDAWARGPVMAYGFTAKVLVRGRGVSRVQALDGSGRTLAEVPTTVTPAGLSFSIDPAHGAIWYDITTP